MTSPSAASGDAIDRPGESSKHHVDDAPKNIPPMVEGALTTLRLVPRVPTRGMTALSVNRNVFALGRCTVGSKMLVEKFAALRFRIWKEARLKPPAHSCFRCPIPIAQPPSDGSCVPLSRRPPFRKRVVIPQSHLPSQRFDPVEPRIQHALWVGPVIRNQVVFCTAQIRHSSLSEPQVEVLEASAIAARV